MDQPTKSPDVAPYAPISRLIHGVAERLPGERITFGELAHAFRDRGFGVLILTFTLPSLIPGIAAVFGLPLLIVGLQMALGRHVIALPAFVARQSLKRADLLRFADFSSGWLRRIERFVRPRPGIFLGNAADRLVGWLVAYAAIMLILPGPGTNGPPAFGCIVMALGLIENDSRTVGIGIVLTFLGNLFATVALGILGFAMVKAVSWVL